MSNVIQFPVIAGIEIHTDDQGRFNLNALHHASGLGESKEPNKWLSLKSTKELVAELGATEGSCGSLINVQKGGVKPGTFTHELLAISFAGWISPKFQLQVNQVFVSYKNGSLAPVHKPVQLFRFDILKIAMEAEVENQRLSIQLDEQKPKIAALDRLASSEGGMCITDAAKQLQLRPRKLSPWLSQNKWIYKRSGSRHWTAYQSKIEAGYLTHKTYTFRQFDDTERTVQQVVVTPKGLARLAELLSIEAAA